MPIVTRPHSLPGRFIAICGCDGVGKTTIIERVAAYLRERRQSVVLTRQPTTEARKNPLFEQFIYRPEERSAIDYRAIMCLLSSDRIQHLKSVVTPALQQGSFVISDRYVYSALAEARARGFGQERWFHELLGSVFPRPDLVLLLSAPKDVVRTRIAQRTDTKAAYVEPGHFERVYDAFEDLTAQEGLVRIDTNRPCDSTFAEISPLIDRLIHGSND